MHRKGPLYAVLVVSAAAVAVIARGAGPGLSPVEELGKKLFFDASLSTPPGQSCAECHDPGSGWTGPISAAVLPGQIYEGALEGRFGNRKPPSSAYAGDSPILHRDEEGNFVGGMFWDGNATGETWKDPLAEQAGGPPLNPLEMNNPDRKSVVAKVRASSYAKLFQDVWKMDAAGWDGSTDLLYERICRAIAAYERSSESSAYRSKFDAFWRAARAKGLDVEEIGEENGKRFAGLGLDTAELRGLVLFNTKGKCAECHVLTPGPNGTPPVLTDYTYDNLGVPKEPSNPFYGLDKAFNPDGKDWVDKGLGGFLAGRPGTAAYAAENMGKHKVPTLRNVDKRPDGDFVKAFMHNGFFKSLEEVVRFYNVRDKGGFPPPEVAANVNRDELGDLGLTESEEADIVAFMRTLSD